MKLIGLKLILILSVWMTKVASRNVFQRGAPQRFNSDDLILIFDESNEETEDPAQQRQSFWTGQVRPQVNAFQQQQLDQLNCVQIGNSHYCPITSHKATWSEAGKYCRSFGMTLAIIESEEENDAVYALAKSRGDNYYWLGATDRGHEGLWLWMATRTPLRYKNWANAQPDNWKVEDPEGEHCMHFGWLIGNRWNDLSCTRKLNFICETTQTESSIPDFSEIFLDVFDDE